DLEPPPEKAAAAIYRSVQEALTNVARHSGATRVDIDLRQLAGAAEERLVLVVRDNGRGATREQFQQGFGLLGIRERAAALGGSLVIPSTETSGFSFELELPLRGQVT